MWNVIFRGRTKYDRFEICSNLLDEVESSDGDLVNCDVGASSDSGFVCFAR